MGTASTSPRTSWARPVTQGMLGLLRRPRLFLSHRHSFCWEPDWQAPLVLSVAEWLVLSTDSCHKNKSQVQVIPSICRPESGSGGGKFVLTSPALVTQ